MLQACNCCSRLSHCLACPLPSLYCIWAKPPSSFGGVARPSLSSLRPLARAIICYLHHLPDRPIASRSASGGSASGVTAPHSAVLLLPLHQPGRRGHTLVMGSPANFVLLQHRNPTRARPSASAASPLTRRRLGILTTSHRRSGGSSMPANHTLSRRCALSLLPPSYRRPNTYHHKTTIWSATE